MITELSQRSREVLRQIVEVYVETGEPVGSKTIANRLPITLSPASIRHVMADLERFGLLFSPHTSAGRLPTEAGLRFFVDGLLEVGNLTEQERSDIEARWRRVRTGDGGCPDRSNTASVRPLPLHGPGRSTQTQGCRLQTGRIRRPLAGTRVGHPSERRRTRGEPRDRDASRPAALGAGRGLELSERAAAGPDSRRGSRRHCRGVGGGSDRAQRADGTDRVEAGLATWGGDSSRETLIVRGQARLLEDVSAVEDLERVRELYDALETKKEVIRLLELTEGGEGVQIYIGAENKLFNMAGCSLIVAPYGNSPQQSDRRDRGHRPETPQLRPHRSHGGLHGKGRGSPRELTCCSGLQRWTKLSRTTTWRSNA